jgi:DNA processing protein
VSVLDPAYPVNLHLVHDRPALLFLRGALAPGDARSIAVVGSRRASPLGRERARRFAHELGAAGYVVVSGLAEGIDAATHRSALDGGNRTLAVLGTGVEQVYPPAHAELQATIARTGAVISGFWPEDPPSAERFPIRNGLMSGLTRATMIIEASARSGTRTQARQALAHGRPVFLHPDLLAQEWARTLVERPNVYVAEDAAALLGVLGGREADGPPTE